LLDTEGNLVARNTIAQLGLDIPMKEVVEMIFILMNVKSLCKA
jgi:hypothetical protein